MTVNVTYGNVTALSPGFAVARGVGSVPAARRMTLARGSRQGPAQAEAPAVPAAVATLRSIRLVPVEGEDEGLAHVLDSPTDSPICSHDTPADTAAFRQPEAVQPRGAREVLVNSLVEGLLGAEPVREPSLRRSTLAAAALPFALEANSLSGGGVMGPLRRVEEALDLSLGVLLHGASAALTRDAAREHHRSGLAAVERLLAADDVPLWDSGSGGDSDAADLLEARAVLRRNLQTAPSCGASLANASASGPVASIGTPVSSCPNRTVDGTAVTLGLLASAIGDLGRLTVQMQAQQSSMISLLGTLDDKFSARDAVSQRV